MTTHPLVSPWMLHDGAGVRAAGERLRELAGLLGGVEVTVASTLGSPVTALGWQGQVTDRAEEASSTARTMLTRLADCCDAAGTALLELAAAMAWHGPRLVELLSDGGGPGPRFGSPGGPGPIFGAEPRDPSIGLPGQPGDPAGASLQSGVGSLTVEPWREVLPVDDRERLVRQHVDDLEVQDQRCHDRLAQVRDDLEAMFPHGTSPEFLRSLVPSQVWRELAAGGIIRHTLPIRSDRNPVVDPRRVGPIRHTLPIRSELRPGCFRVVEPPVRHTLPIREGHRPGDFRTEPPVRHTLPIREGHRPGDFRTEPPVRHTLPIREERTVLAGADVDPGPVTTVEPMDR
ncbi:hypothetical protein [Ornithinimicrobium pratense]|uniref:Uncharacterized protein n=1 Tax=Ornithinimicrobium pratense TaxID=2593973 RepID=A0A5J6V1G1_9MICO|nr:hypothetical protein [Ornithinimicrobium pratense]QFG67397.1 hypothetical protein FY030_00460 [Ornithinimicrobium pratense]